MYIILIAGLPAAGKSSFTAYLSKKLAVPSFNMDKVNEILFDSIGFSSYEQKESLNQASFRIQLQMAESCMRVKKPLVLEGNFDKSMKEPLSDLIEEYGYACLTLYFGGNIEALYGRYAFRENSPSRHPGHGQYIQYPPEEKGTPPVVPSLDEFRHNVTEKGMLDFSIGGERICIDTTDLGTLHYDDVVGRVQAFTERRR